MGFSIRSGFRGGISVVVAGAVALTPAIVQEPQPLPITARVTSPAVELAAAVDPQPLIDALQGAVNSVGTGVTNLALLPPQLMYQATTAAEAGVAKLYGALIAAATDPSVKAVLTQFEGIQTANLGYLLNTAADLEGRTDYWMTDPDVGLAANLEDALNGAIQLTLTAIAGAINAPLDLSSWASLLSSTVYSTLWGAGHLSWAAYAGLAMPLDLLAEGYGGGTYPDYSGVAEWAGASLANWAAGSAAVLSGLATSTGSPLIENLTKAALAITTTPTAILARGIADASFWAPVFTAVALPTNLAWAAANLAGAFFYGAGNSIGGAIDAIGAGPLNPASYITALQGFVTAGFNLGSEAAWSAQAVAQTAPEVFNSVAFASKIGANALVNAVAASASGLLAAAGAAPAIVAAPINAAAQITTGITNVTTTLTDASKAFSSTLFETAQKINAASDAARDEINNWLGGLVPGSVAAAAADEAPSRPAAVAPSASVVRKTPVTGRSAKAAADVPAAADTPGSGNDDSHSLADGSDDTTPHQSDSAPRPKHSIGSARTGGSHRSSATAGAARHQGAA